MLRGLIYCSADIHDSVWCANWHVVSYLNWSIFCNKNSLPSYSNSIGTVCESNFWLDLNYLEVAKAAQFCSAHFTALLYTEIYVDKIKASMEENSRYEGSLNFNLSHQDGNRIYMFCNLKPFLYIQYKICRARPKATRRINFEDSSQNFTISSLTEKSMEDTKISLQVSL